MGSFAAAVAAAAGVIAGVKWYATAGPPAPVPRATVEVATVAVERTDLSTAKTMPGNLGYGVPRAVKATSGTVTWLPSVGAAVKRGGVLYRNDDHPVVVLYGTTPLFRELNGPDLTGRDVRVVLDNLRALGYPVSDQPQQTKPKPPKPPVRPGDGVLTPQAILAIKAWQLDAGLPVTGVIKPADVVVLPGPTRVSRVTAQVGDPASGEILAVTGSKKAVTVPVRVSELGSIKTGVAVQVELPGGSTTPGKVSRIDRNARPAEADGQDATAAEVDVTVTVQDAKAVKNLDSAPVQVSFAGESRKDILAVPVAALLALREGGHAVQVAGGRLVAVETGMFAMGLVEVSGDGLAEGTRVVTVS
ncbi:hypothetical protein ADL15_33560 [Actinoplanes awajinensis subsp. mycoplanecinus]|uniref:Peptidoglycan binding-like domain-containing protein n=1 Tax=Actinoplanes awajinensis subsp. mycoplanecinus TaxID=135947 RepID=A0A101JJ19_9ACTN|nr:hypothetical protein ADL15_33560 [Actinoplanes awajinensis subsp. mycoplanecinus]